jgi:hypothetical protein
MSYYIPKNVSAGEVGKRSRSNEWPTAGTLHILDEHLRELAECKRAAKQLLSAVQRDLKQKLQNLMEQLTVSPGVNTDSIVEDHIFFQDQEKDMFREIEIAEVVTHLSLWRADFLAMPPSLLYCSNMTVLNLSGSSI